MEETNPTANVPNDPTSSPPSDPDTVANPPPEMQPEKKKHTSLLVLIGVMIATALLIPAFQQTQTLMSQAAGKKCMMIGKVMINPGMITTNIGNPPINMSVLAYDATGKPIWNGVKYDWGISSINSIGTLKPRQDIAAFTALNIGTGDLYVKATNSCTKKAIIGSVKVTVSQAIIPIPTNPKKK